jgi:hypothetical protein
VIRFTSLWSLWSLGLCLLAGCQGGGRSPDAAEVPAAVVERAVVLAVKPAGASGPVKLYRQKNVKLVGLVIDRAGPEGIFLEDCTGVLIDRCQVSRCGTLIRLLRCRGVVIRGCTLKQPTGPADPDGQGVQLNECEEVEVSGCTMTAGTGGPVEDWVSVFRSRKVAVRDNVITGGAGSPSGTGVCVDGPDSQDVEIRGNTLSRCGAIGVSVAGGKRIRIVGNRILDTFVADSDAGNVGVAVFTAYGKAPAEVWIGYNVVSVRRKDGTENAFWDETGRVVWRKNVTGERARKILTEAK